MDRDGDTDVFVGFCELLRVGTIYISACLRLAFVCGYVNPLQLRFHGLVGQSAPPGHEL